MTKIPVDLGPVQETLLIPLLGRAVETQKDNGLIKDEKAVEIVSALDYDFSKWKKSRALAGATLTSVGVDNLVRFWMGEAGYAPFLAKLQAGEI